jgi:hypothetical protein
VDLRVSPSVEQTGKEMTMGLRYLTEEEARELRALSEFQRAFGGSLNGKEYALVLLRCRRLVGLSAQVGESVELERN